MLLSKLLPLEMCAPEPGVAETRYFSQWSRSTVPSTYLDGAEEDCIQVKKSPPEQSGSGFIINGDAVARVAHLEHSVRFLQEQHRLMLSGLHAEIEALRERNRDLQFQLIFNKESSLKASTPAVEENAESNEEVANLKADVARLEREAAAARGEARAAEARALQLQRLVDAQTEKLREFELKTNVVSGGDHVNVDDGADETRAELRARLAEAERLVRRLRGDADRQRRELQCMKNSLHASLRASGLDGYGYQNNYHFPPLHAPEFWREPLRDEYPAGVAGVSRGVAGLAVSGVRARRPLTLPELQGQQVQRSTVYANIYVTDHVRARANGYEHKKKQPSNGEANMKIPDDPPAYPSLEPQMSAKRIKSSFTTFPELQFVVTKTISHENVNGQAVDGGVRPRVRRHHHRKHAPDHT